MKQTYGRRDRREDAIRTWLPAIVLYLGRQSEGFMLLISKCSSVLRCSGVVKRTWAIFATYVRCNRPQSTMRFWQSSHRSLRETPCWPHGVSASRRGRSRCWNEVTGVVVPQHPIEFWHSNQE